jgi:hypothetical protein
VLDLGSGLDRECELHKMNPDDFIAQIMAPQREVPSDLLPLIALLLMQVQQPQQPNMVPSLSLERQGHPLTDIVPSGTPQPPAPATEHVRHPANEDLDVETHYSDVV